MGFSEVERVVVGAAFHPGGGEPVAEFDAADARDGEHRVGEQRLDAVPEGLAETGGKAVGNAFDDGAERVALRSRGGELRCPERSVGLRRAG